MIWKASMRISPRLRFLQKLSWIDREIRLIWIARRSTSADLGQSSQSSWPAQVKNS